MLEAEERDDARKAGITSLVGEARALNEVNNSDGLSYRQSYPTYRLSYDLSILFPDVLADNMFLGYSLLCVTGI